MAAVIPNGLSSTACLCGGSGTAMHPAATGGTATLTMACDTDCDGAEGSAASTSAEVAGPIIGPHRLDDATALDLADALEERRCRCRQSSGSKQQSTSQRLKPPEQA
ncbi:MAG: hypothetical protein KJZ69_18675 [Phycisphaerales bacterium]|nr:hypothetical protein [Phycisphaerales bacterium]